eukprot:gnl/MRDRNA2_/MRDRNA2_84363_c0_seq2.p1 gnl/MRDRNA2_/MRDRNA2_84363_c0~~gnl/MRDRNA2_/MRDRNA2_84363_c0_seq2.p1  ORF type:complete len:684 (+),score=237.38 gnl/MRDRNA2_/MRDRNA2_84363_c0_seq2:72-2123(+)
MLRCIAIVLLAAPAFCINLEAASSVVESIGDEDSKTRPVAKVVALLKDMQVELQKELDDDKAVYEMLTCWCKTNEEEKTKAIEVGEATIDALEAEIGEAAAKIQELKETLKQAKDKINKDFDATQESASMRMKENKEFHAEETDLIGAIKACEQALVVLGKHNPSMTQLSTVGRSLEGIAHSMMIPRMLNSVQAAALKMFVKHVGHPDSFLGTNSLAVPGYESGSGQIFGILKQMKEGFETNMADASTEEKRAADEFASMKKAKSDQIKAAEDLSKSKTIELGDTKATLAADKQDLKDTTAKLEADTKFLEDVKSTCATADEDYQARLKVRTEEITAVSETIGILTDDEAQTAFSKSSAASFIQLSQMNLNEGAKRQRKKAVQLMAKAATKSGDAQLGKLASQAKLLDFSEIKKAIDGMMAELKTTQKDEADKYEFCTSEIKANEKETAAKHELKADLETKIADLESLISTLTDEIAALKAEVAQTNVEMKAASQQREAENKDFQVTVADQKATQAILKKAIERMKAFYGFIQTKQTQPKQGTYGKSAGGSHVLNLLGGIIGESADVEKKALNAENEAQAAYESYIAMSNAANAAASNSIVNKSGEMAMADKDKIQATESRDSTIQDLLLLGERNAALHQECDFLITNFETTQSARSEEIESLFNAKAIFSGASFGFLQQHQF